MRDIRGSKLLSSSSELELVTLVKMGFELRAQLAQLKAANANAEPSREEWANVSGMVRIMCTSSIETI